MAKHITKSVIEDIAYELKSAGQWAHEYKHNPQYIQELGLGGDLSDPEVVLDELIESLADMLAGHDPSFDRQLFKNQAEYRVNI